MKKKIVHVDGGAFIEPPNYKFHNAYFSIVGSNKKLIHFAKDIGDFYSGLAEYCAIKWAVENIKERPLKIYSDCITAMAWARKGNEKWGAQKLDLGGIALEWKHDNFADKWNAKNHSPKRSKKEYIKRYYKEKSSLGKENTQQSNFLKGLLD